MNELEPRARKDRTEVARLAQVTYNPVFRALRSSRLNATCPNSPLNKTELAHARFSRLTEIFPFDEILNALLHLITYRPNFFCR